MPLAVTHAPVDRVSEYKLEGQHFLTIGRFSYIDGRARVYYFAELSPIRIGSFCSVANNVSFFMRANHRNEWITAYPIAFMPWPESLPKPPDPHRHGKGEIIIGNDVWIGDGARFLPGVRVGDGATIAASTVVTRDVPPYCLYAGNPGRVRKFRFAEQEVKFLLEAKWWDLPLEQIKRLAPIICSSDVNALRRALSSR